MPIHVNSIGAFTFFDLVGTIYPRQEQLEIIERPGVDGSGARRSGARGKPFVLVSVAYYTDWTDYHMSLYEYKDLVGQDPQTLTRNDEDYGTFLVLEVTEVQPPQAVMNVAGDPTKQVRGVTRWTMLG